MSFAAILDRLARIEIPYPGLRPFEADEAHLFFGGDEQVAEVLARLSRNRMVAIIGVSGSGKSSLIRAGLIPALTREGKRTDGSHYRVVVMRPGAAPFESLAASLGARASELRESSYGLLKFARRLPPGETLLLVVDQFEELFRYKDTQSVTDEARLRRIAAAAEAAEFVQLLLASIRNEPLINIVITMRSDYLGECSEFRDFPEALNESQYLVPRLSREQRRQSVEGPLNRTGISSRLVQRILNDAGDEPDQLPILQHALMRTFSHWRKTDPERTRKIDLEDYEAIGGFENALNNHANELLNSLPDPADVTIVEAIFRRLTAQNLRSRERRDPATLAELFEVCAAETPEQQARVVAVIDHFRMGEATFLTPRTGELAPGTYIDITHESLIRQWKQLSDVWLPKEQAAVKMFTDLIARAQRWEHGGETLIGRDLTDAMTWNQASNHSSGWARQHAGEAATLLVARFLEASNRAADAAVRRERRRRRQWIAVWIVAAALAVIFLAVTNNNLRQKALEREKDAQDAQKDAARLRDLQAKADAGEAELHRRAVERSQLFSTVVRKEIEYNVSLPGERTGITIQYFAKATELHLSLIPAFRKLGFNVVLKPAKFELATNEIWYGSQVDVNSLRIAAYTLLEHGVPLRQIEPLSKSNMDAGRERVIQIGWSNSAESMGLMLPLQIKTFQMAKLKK